MNEEEFWKTPRGSALWSEIMRPERGRNYGPIFLSRWERAGRLTREELRAIIIGIWQSAEWPAQTLGVRRWISLFKRAGFVTDAPGEARPTEPTVLYRGTTFTHKRGMSWTPDADRARWFALRTALLRPAAVFIATVPPEHILARVVAGRGENETIVNSLARWTRDICVHEEIPLWEEEE